MIWIIENGGRAYPTSLYCLYLLCPALFFIYLYSFIHSFIHFICLVNKFIIIMKRIFIENCFIPEIWGDVSSFEQSHLSSGQGTFWDGSSSSLLSVSSHGLDSLRWNMSSLVHSSIMSGVCCLLCTKRTVFVRIFVFLHQVTHVVCNILTYDVLTVYFCVELAFRIITRDRLVLWGIDKPPSIASFRAPKLYYQL